MTLFDKVKMLAEKRGISICALERRAGVSNGTISKWREGSPKVDTLKKVAEVLKVEIEELI